MRSRGLQFISVYSILLVCLGVAFGQTKVPPKTSDIQEEEILKVNTQLVDVPTIVVDKTGKPLVNLKASNFVIYEDGKKQTLTNFATADAPFEVALLLDTSGSTRADLALIQQAAEGFLASLREGDKVSVIAFNTGIIGDKKVAFSEILSNLTNDRNVLKEAIANAKTSHGTPLYDGLVQVADKIFRDSPKKEFRGRRALVALTDGVDSVSENEFAEAKEKLTNRGITNYFISVDTRDFFEDRLLGDCQSTETLRFSTIQLKRYYTNFYKNAKAERVFDFCKIGDFERLAISKKLYELANYEMNDLARNSGGKMFGVGSLKDANRAFQQVAREIGTQYSLGYYSDNEKRDGSFRKIRVELKNVPVGARIQARDGYTAPKE